MMTVAEFYAVYAADDPFGSYKDRDPNGPGHLGSDFPWGAGTEIPSWVSGEVVRVGFSRAIGYYVVIAGDGGGYALFYHLLEHSHLAVGDRVKFGDKIGLVGNTGTTSNGNHLHAGFSPTDPTPGTGAVVDPWPLIRAAMTTKKRRYPMSSVLIRPADTGKVKLWNLATDTVTPVSNPGEYARLQEFLPVSGFATEADFTAFRKKYGPALREPASGGASVPLVVELTGTARPE